MTDFLWGAATSSYQIEGDNRHSDWWEWENLGKVEGGARCGTATDHLHRFKEDIRLAAELGIKSYRFSVEWSRVEPQESQFDQTALDWYAQLLDECDRYEIVPMLTLHHFTNPAWFIKQGGFTSPGSPRVFLRYVDQVVKALGSRVRLWCTFNEPMVYAMGAYIAGIMPPGIYSPIKAALVCRHLLQAHVLAYDALHSTLDTQSHPRPLEVGIAHNLLDFKPARFFHPIEQILTGILTRFYNLSWLDAVTGHAPRFSIPGLIPKVPPVPEAQGRVTTDFIGINYYTKAYVQWRPKATAEGTLPKVPIGLFFAKRGEPKSDLGWAIHPQGFKKIIRKVHRYGLPIYITENGIADSEDLHRAEYIEKHIGVIQDALKDGIPIKGYYYWSLLDNFEWIKGFGPQFGLYHVDYQTHQRTCRPSAHHYSTLIQGQTPNTL